MEIHIARDGRQLGPFSPVEVQRMLNAGEASPTDLAWTPGSANWVPLNTIPGAIPGATPSDATAPPALPPVSTLRAYAPQAAAGVMAAGGYARPVQPTSGLAVASLVLGIAGLIFAPIFASIPAIITGHMARGEIRRSEGSMGGDGMAVAGLVTGYLSLVFWALMIVLVICMAVGMVTTIPKLMTQANNPPNDPKSVVDARKVVLACSSYASQHDGAYPATLEDLVPEYLEGYYLDSSDHVGQKAYEYIGGRDTDPSNKILFFSRDRVTDDRPSVEPRNSNKVHVVARVDGTVTIEELPAKLKERIPH